MWEDEGEGEGIVGGGDQGWGGGCTQWSWEKRYGGRGWGGEEEQGKEERGRRKGEEGWNK